MKFGNTSWKTASLTLIVSIFAIILFLLSMKKIYGSAGTVAPTLSLFPGPSGVAKGTAAKIRLQSIGNNNLKNSHHDSQAATERCKRWHKLLPYS
jgi:hypothetical protein